jgi:hypothetical protein
MRIRFLTILMAVAAVFAQQAVAKNHKTTKTAAAKKHHKKHNKKAGATNLRAPISRSAQALS